MAIQDLTDMMPEKLPNGWERHRRRKDGDTLVIHPAIGKPEDYLASLHRFYGPSVSVTPKTPEQKFRQKMISAAPVAGVRKLDITPDGRIVRNTGALLDSQRAMLSKRGGTSAPPAGKPLGFSGARDVMDPLGIFERDLIGGAARGSDANREAFLEALRTPRDSNGRLVNAAPAKETIVASLGGSPKKTVAPVAMVKKTEEPTFLNADQPVMTERQRLLDLRKAKADELIARNAASLSKDRGLSLPPDLQGSVVASRGRAANRENRMMNRVGLHTYHPNDTESAQQELMARAESRIPKAGGNLISTADRVAAAQSKLGMASVASQSPEARLAAKVLAPSGQVAAAKYGWGPAAAETVAPPLKDVVTAAPLADVGRDAALKAARERAAARAIEGRQRVQQGVQARKAQRFANTPEGQLAAQQAFLLKLKQAENPAKPPDAIDKFLETPEGQAYLKAKFAATTAP